MSPSGESRSDKMAAYMVAESVGESERVTRRIEPMVE